MTSSEHTMTSSEHSIFCQFCNLEFQFQQSLKRHILDVHLKSRPYSCDLCNKTYKRNEHLKEHVATKHLNISRIEHRLNKKVKKLQ